MWKVLMWLRDVRCAIGMRSSHGRGEFMSAISNTPEVKCVL